MSGFSLQYFDKAKSIKFGTNNCPLLESSKELLVWSVSLADLRLESVEEWQSLRAKLAQH
jgi:hypothetical protein